MSRCSASAIPIRRFPTVQPHVAASPNRPGRSRLVDCGDRAGGACGASAQKPCRRLRTRSLEENASVRGAQRTALSMPRRAHGRLRDRRSVRRYRYRWHHAERVASIAAVSCGIVLAAFTSCFPARRPSRRPSGKRFRRTRPDSARRSADVRRGIRSRTSAYTSGTAGMCTRARPRGDVIETSLERTESPLVKIWRGGRRLLANLDGADSTTRRTPCTRSCRTPPARGRYVSRRASPARSSSGDDRPVLGQSFPHLGAKRRDGLPSTHHKRCIPTTYDAGTMARLFP